MNNHLCEDSRSVNGSLLKKSISGREDGLFGGSMVPGLTWDGNEEPVFSGDSAASGLFSGPGETWRIVRVSCWAAWIVNAEQYCSGVQMDKNYCQEKHNKYKINDLKKIK